MSGANAAGSAGTPASDSIRAESLLVQRHALIGISVCIYGVLLSIDRLRLPIDAQVLPPLGLVAACLLPVVLIRIQNTPVLKAVLLFVTLVFLQSFVAVLVDMVVFKEGAVRVGLWIRQVIALLAGLGIFIVLRAGLEKASDRQICTGILIGAIPSLTVGFINVLWGITGSEVCGAIVTGVRDIILGPAEAFFMTATSYRAAGLSNEPSGYAFYLSNIVLPMGLVGAITRTQKRGFFILMAGWTLVCLLWTFSSTGFVVLVSMLLATVALGPRRGLFLGITSIVLTILVLAILVWIPSVELFGEKQNYILHAWENYNANDPRVYSTFGPILTLFDSYGILGYGLGGTSAHIAEIVPEDALEGIFENSWEGTPNLKTLGGRLVAETGFPGIFLMAFIFLIAARVIRKQSSKGGGAESELSILVPARWALVGAVIGLGTGGVGSFASPFLWFWLAVVDSRSIRDRRQVSA